MDTKKECKDKKCSPRRSRRPRYLRIITNRHKRNGRGMNNTKSKKCGPFGARTNRYGIPTTPTNTDRGKGGKCGKGAKRRTKSLAGERDDKNYLTSFGRIKKEIEMQEYSSGNYSEYSYPDC